MHLLACNGDVSPSGADEPNGALLSGLDADGTAVVSRSRARHRVALTATAPSCRGTGRRFTCISILSTSDLLITNMCIVVHLAVDYTVIFAGKPSHNNDLNERTGSEALRQKNQYIKK